MSATLEKQITVDELDNIEIFGNFVEMKQFITDLWLS